MHRFLACPACPQLLSLLAKVDDWGYDTMALDDASNGHALSVLGFVFITRTEAFKKFRTGLQSGEEDCTYIVAYSTHYAVLHTYSLITHLTEP